MIWRPDFTIQQREDTAKRELKEKVMGVIDESYNIPRNPISDTTDFIVSSTTLDTTQMVDEQKFKNDHENELLIINKFPALSNIDDVDRVLTRLKWTDMQFCKQMGLTHRATEKALEIAWHYNESRGLDFGFQRALITQRQEINAKSYNEPSEYKKGFLSSLRRNKEVQPIQQQEQQQ